MSPALRLMDCPSAWPATWRPREWGQPMPTLDGAARCSANGPTPPPAGPVGLSILASSINIIFALSISLSLNHSLALTPARQRPRPGVTTSSGLPRPHVLAPLPPDSLSAISAKCSTHRPHTLTRGPNLGGNLESAHIDIPAFSGTPHVKQACYASHREQLRPCECTAAGR